VDRNANIYPTGQSILNLFSPKSGQKMDEVNQWYLHILAVAQTLHTRSRAAKPQFKAVTQAGTSNTVVKTN